jgi:hypothetical protein
LAIKWFGSRHEEKTLRNYENHWEWFDKQRKELGIVED